MDYPQEWNELPKHEKKKKLRALKKEHESKAQRNNTLRNWVMGLGILVLLVIGYKVLTAKSPEEIAFEQEIQEVSLEGRVEQFPIEGQEHVPLDTEVAYNTNPPTSGSHLAIAENWGIYNNEIDDKAAVHALEHGGIWISYKDISDEQRRILEELGRENSKSVVVSPRDVNDSPIAVVSWGRMMQLEEADKALIQKYIEMYKNQSPEKLAR